MLKKFLLKVFPFFRLEAMECADVVVADVSHKKQAKQTVDVRYFGCSI